MIVRVNIKQLGKKRDKISDVDFVLENTPKDVRSLICEAVHTCVDSYNKRVLMGQTAPRPLTDNQIENMSEIGKITFGISYTDKKADREKAIADALLAYSDGLFKIFINDIETGDLSDEIALADGDRLTFVRLTMLTGRLW